MIGAPNTQTLNFMVRIMNGELGTLVSQLYIKKQNSFISHQHSRQMLDLVFSE